MEDAVGYPFLGITRHNLQRALVSHLDDDVLELGCRLKELRASPRSSVKELVFEGKASPVRARSVIGADGLRWAGALFFRRSRLVWWYR